MNVGVHPLDYISLCTGGGGLDLGLELAVPSARAVLCVEREAFAIAHLVEAMQAGILADAPVWSDARTLDGRPWRGLVDGLIGGIPCQPHSVAGRKGGQHDDRDLWSDARRIIVQARPWFVLIENVAGMLSAGADEIAGAERVWRDLRRMGFDVEAGLFTAAEVGAPHKRERLFILGVADASRSGPQGRERRGPSGERHGPFALGPAPELRGPCLEHAARLGRGEGRPEPELRSGRRSATGAGDSLADAISRGHDGRALEPIEGQERGASVAGAGETIGLFPPGPGDLAAWADTLARAPQFEPAVRRVADGLASTRTDWLRLLGNGVVPLAAAYAVRTLVSRLAERSPAAATLDVRVMA